MTLLTRPRVMFVIGSMGGGGAERQVLEILKRLDRSRFEPVLYLAAKQGELLAEVPPDVPIFAYWDGAKETWPGRLLRWMKLTRFLRYLHVARVLHQQKIDVVYDRTYLATLDAAGGCCLRPTPRISCCVVDPRPELELYARFSVALSWWFARYAYRTATVVLANSEGLRNRFLEYFRLKPDHVQVFYNLLVEIRTATPTAATSQRENEKRPTNDDPRPSSVISVEESSTRPEEVSGQRLEGIDAASVANASLKPPFLIVNAGRLHPQKGHRILLEAIDELVHRRGRKLRLMIFGQGESESDLRDFVSRHRLEQFVTIAGFVVDPRHWYQDANLFVLSSFFEGMPNALIEAVACGIPVLSTDCPSGPAEILDNGRCGRLLPTGDVQALAMAIEDAMDHPDEWSRRAALARKRVETMFDPNANILRLENLFEQVAQSDRGTRPPPLVP